MTRAPVAAAVVAAMTVWFGPASARIQLPTPGEAAFVRAEANGRRVDDLLGRARRVMHAWLRHADARTRLLPDYLPSFRPETPRARLYTPHNSGADNYPFLIATAWFTDRAIYDGRMREMLRNEMRFTMTGTGCRARWTWRRASSVTPTSSARPSTRKTASSR